MCPFDDTVPGLIQYCVSWLISVMLCPGIISSCRAFPSAKDSLVLVRSSDLSAAGSAAWKLTAWFYCSITNIYIFRIMELWQNAVIPPFLLMVQFFSSVPGMKYAYAAGIIGKCLWKMKLLYVAPTRSVFFGSSPPELSAWLMTLCCMAMFAHRRQITDPAGSVFLPEPNMMHMQNHMFFNGFSAYPACAAS